MSADTIGVDVIAGVILRGPVGQKGFQYPCAAAISGVSKLKKRINVENLTKEE